MNELAKRENIIPALSVGPFIVTRTGLILEREPAWDEWQAFFDGMQGIEDAVLWVIGDALCKIETQYGDEGSQLLAAFPEYKYKRLIQWRWVASKVTFSFRKENLSWTHHEQVAALEPEEQKKWLQLAIDNKWTVQELRSQIRRARLNDVEILGSFETMLYHGDMLDIVPKLEAFDLVVTDPPYGVEPQYDSVQEIEWDILDDFLSSCREWLTTICNALKPEYNLFWFCSPSYASDIEMIFRELDLSVRSRIVWNKRSLPKGRHARNKFVGIWEMILHAGNRELNFPSDWSDAWFDVQNFVQPLTSHRGANKKIHETQKPHELIKRLVEFGSYPGDRILDPFAGSGSVGAACPENRECILIELEKKYVTRIEQRLGIRARSNTRIKTS